jgi:hypothetical protein
VISAADAQILSRLRVALASSAELERALGASQSSMSATLRRLVKEGRVVRIGTTKGARYGLRREIEGIGSAWPIYQITRVGSIETLGMLYALGADQYYVEADKAALALHGFGSQGVSTGLPYFLQDQRPAGFLGRAVPHQYPDLRLPQRVQDWTDDHYLRYLTLRGSDTVGDLIVGQPALDMYLARQREPTAISIAERERSYPSLATEVMAGGLPGSSAAGEHPKFAVLLKDGSAYKQVLVKFSPSIRDPVGQRWSDLLMSEHHAHEVSRAAGILAAQSRIYQIQDRTYLEVDRFDREGRDGRIGVTSLLAIDTGFYGKLDNWIASANRLYQDERINLQALEQIKLIATFGTLIANTDLHFGNLSFFDDYSGHFNLAPVYDMLPMLFAPAHDQLVARVYTPPDPTSQTLKVWGRARVLAEKFWRTVSADTSISAEFRQITTACLQTIEAYPKGGAYAA